MYEDYMSRMLEESVQYKPKEENEIEKYMDYEVKEEKEPKDEELPTGIVALMIFSYVVFFGGIVFVLYEAFNGG